MHNYYTESLVTDRVKKKNGGKFHCSCPVATYSKQGSLYVQFVKLMSAKQRKFIKID